MNWFPKAFTITWLSVCLNPWVAGSITLIYVILAMLAHGGMLPHSLWVEIPCGFVVLMTATAHTTTLGLWLAIADAMLTHGNKLPAWAWFYNTPDSPNSPYSDYEKAALPYYRYGRFIGDYLWLALRNSWYGLSFRWGLTPDPTWHWTYNGDPYTADMNPRTGAFVYGHLSVSATKNGAQVAWAKRGVVRVGSSWMIKYWFGWKLSEYVQPGAKPVPPAMIAVQIEPRKAR